VLTDARADAVWHSLKPTNAQQGGFGSWASRGWQSVARLSSRPTHTNSLFRPAMRKRAEHPSSALLALLPASARSRRRNSSPVVAHTSQSPRGGEFKVLVAAG